MEWNVWEKNRNSFELRAFISYRCRRTTLVLANSVARPQCCVKCHGKSILSIQFKAAYFVLNVNFIHGAAAFCAGIQRHRENWIQSGDNILTLDAALHAADNHNIECVEKASNRMLIYRLNRCEWTDATANKHTMVYVPWFTDRTKNSGRLCKR